MARLTDKEFLELLEAHRHELYSYVCRTVWNMDTADDVMAAGVMAAYEQLDRFEKGTNFRAWMYRILTNKCFVANRETRRNAIDVESIGEQHFAIDDDAVQEAYRDPEWFLEQCGDELVAALDRLSTAERACLYLLSVAGYSYKEIGGILDMPVGTVMTHLARGRRKLRQRLAEYARDKGIISAKKRRERGIPDDQRRAS